MERSAKVGTFLAGLVTLALCACGGPQTIKIPAPGDDPVGGDTGEFTAPPPDEEPAPKPGEGDADAGVPSLPDDGSTKGDPPPPKGGDPAAGGSIDAPLEVEPNDDSSTADLIELGKGRTGVIPNADDVDFYGFILDAPRRIELHLDGLDADFDLAVFNRAGELQAVSRNAGSASELIAGDATAGVFIVAVFPFQGASSQKPYVVSLK